MRALMLIVFLLPVQAFAQTSLSSSLPDHPVFGRFKRVQAYGCANVSCKSLRSCDEACYKLQVYGQSVRDGDNDGIPCENLCSRRC